MFWKVFLVFSCLVLYTRSNPTSETNHYRRDLDQLKHLLNTVQIDCGSLYVQDISFTLINNPYEAIPGTFCQISKALAPCNSNNTDMQQRQLWNLINRVKGNATCDLRSGTRIPIESFCAKVKSYITSLDTLPPN